VTKDELVKKDTGRKVEERKQAVANGSANSLAEFIFGKVTTAMKCWALSARRS